MSGGGQVWATALHRLWRAVATIGAREDLAALVLPPLQALPGVIAVWGVRHAADGAGIAALRWRGLPVDEAQAARLLATGGAEIPPELREQGVHRVVAAGFEVPGELSGSILLLASADADAPSLTECLGQVVDVTREAVRRLGARRAAEEEQVRDALLAEASLQMDAVLDTGQTLQRVARMAVPAIAEGCLVYVCSDDELGLRSAVHVDMRKLDAMLADAAAAGALAELAGRAVAGRPERLRAVTGWTRTVDAQVLRARGRVVGVLLFLFDRGDELIPSPAFLRDLTHRAALAIDNGELYEQRRREMIALQQHLLPRRLPAPAGVALAASYTVGDQVLEVGGDFYDVVVRADGVLAALIGDVCGRGVEAAALTGMSRHTLGTLLQEGVSPARALGRLNAGLLRDGSWRFVTAGVGLIRPAGGGLSVQWTSAGHPPPVVLRRGGPAEPGRGGGVPLGVVRKPSVGRSRLLLGPGDTLLMFTDGLTESRDACGRLFEDAGLEAALDKLNGAPLDELVHELSRAAAEFGTTGADDIAVLALRASGE
ncbi:PP2C family protein-serine/threonine phosphatase [Symbioplanes lichenis]|uniref:PP2C family protein-serine/threonine phosphatase n=1 Tax=Symbioplanes lichenis TaxID=1629072 RepID=UPI00273A13CA|nr:PP2C family protein-serine/threonine phosphatase [Actinoplanes lichenis]